LLSSTKTKRIKNVTDIASALILQDLDIDLEKGISRKWSSTLRSIGRIATKGSDKVSALRKDAFEALNLLIDTFYPKSYRANNRTVIKVHMSRHPEVPTALISRTEHGGHKVVIQRRNAEHTVFARNKEGEYLVDIRGDGLLKPFSSLPEQTQILLGSMANIVGRTFVAKKAGQF
jgi:hypothetical protein